MISYGHLKETAQNVLFCAAECTENPDKDIKGEENAQLRLAPFWDSNYVSIIKGSVDHVLDAYALKNCRRVPGN